MTSTFRQTTVAAILGLLLLAVWWQISGPDPNGALPAEAGGNRSDSDSLTPVPSEIVESSADTSAEFPSLAAADEESDAPLRGDDGDFRALPKTEQESLWVAFHAARHAIEPLTEAEASLEQNEGVRFFAFNPGQQITARFLDGAMRLQSGRGGDWAGTLALRREGGAVPARPVRRGDAVEYDHGNGLIEWYRNKAEGIEHGFTVGQRPSTTSEGDARVELFLEGLTAREISPESGSGKGRDQALAFVDPESGKAVLKYSELKVWDSTGKAVPATMEATASGLAILMADAGAAYPLTIDPLITSEEAKLFPPYQGDGGDGLPSAAFGHSVAISGDTALIGAIRDDTAAGSTAGSVYVFGRTGNLWSQTTKLTADDASAYDNFGSSVAYSGSTALIGAFGDSSAAGAGAGSAYVFEQSGNTWTQEAKLIPGDGKMDGNFGVSVALSGETALIGAAYYDGSASPFGPPETDPGSAYVFVRSGGNWSEQAKLTASDGAGGDKFGYAVSLSGDTALVGAFHDDTAVGGSNAGSAYVFVRSENSWSEQAKLEAGDAAADEEFGYSVALSGETALVGAVELGDGRGIGEGSAYVFVRSGSSWSEQAKLVASDSAARNVFGSSVALSGDLALVGASGDNVSRGAAYVFVRSGSAWSQEAKLTASDGDSSDRLGVSVAFSGDTALVGAPGDETPAGSFAGSAYVFVRSGTSWSEQEKIDAGDGDTGFDFGTAVALSGDTAVAGAKRDSTAGGAGAGAVYVFVRNGDTWSQEARLTASDGEQLDQFGISVAISGDTVLAGADYADSAAGFSTGKAYVFVRVGNSWSEQTMLAAGDAGVFDHFGISVALSGETALIGARSSDTQAGSNAGSAYVFVRNGSTWSEQAKLTAQDGAAFDYFGYAVAVSGDTALVGAYGADTAGGSRAGSAYVFVRNGITWSEQAKLTADDGAGFDYFGNSVALSGDTALIGARSDDTPAGSGAGSAYVFVRNSNSWEQQAKLTAGDAEFGDQFGYSVALAGDTALIGAIWDDTTADYNTGSAYVFMRSGSTWSQQGLITASDGARSDNFGYAVALSGDTALIGSAKNDGINPVSGKVRADLGAVYVFRLSSAVEPSVTTSPAVDVTENAASVGGNVLDDGEQPLPDRGIVWSTQPNPTLADGTTVSSGAGFGTFTAPLSGLIPGTTYHARAFAARSTCIGYGDDIYFTTATTVTFSEGLAAFTRDMLPGDRQVFHFTLSDLRAMSIATQGGAALRAELFDDEGALLVSADTDGDLDLGPILPAGDYSLHVFREPDEAGVAQPFTMELDTTSTSFPRADVAVGGSLAGLKGDGIYGTAVGQTVNLVSRKARTVRGVATIENDGDISGDFFVRGTRGNQWFKVSYLTSQGNMTAAVVAGTHHTGPMAPGAAAYVVNVTIKPNRKKLVKTIDRGGKRRTIARRKRFTVVLSGSLQAGAIPADDGYLRTRTR